MMIITDEMKSAWFRTFSGRRFPIFTPRLSDYELDDIAASLSKQCRFNGHTKRFYSVAQHSLNVYRIVSEPAKGWALFHDAGEAYVSDVITPLKRHLPLVKDAEERIQDDLILRYAISYDNAIAEEVHAADRYMVFLEAETLLNNANTAEWSLERIPFEPQGKPYLGPSHPLIDEWLFKRAVRRLIADGEIEV
jgi:hypothetical protein